MIGRIKHGSMKFIMNLKISSAKVTGTLEPRRLSGLKPGNSGRMVELDKQDHEQAMEAENNYLHLIAVNLCKMILLNIQELNFKG
jgi:hypothetical protein